MRTQPRRPGAFPILRSLALAALALGLAAPRASAQVDLSVSFDANTAFSTVTPADEQASQKDVGGVWSNAVAALTAALPSNVNLRDFGYVQPTRVYFSLEETAVLGGTTYANQDVILWNGSVFSLAWQGTANGLPSYVGIDALDIISEAPLTFLFSLDADAVLTVASVATAVADEDIVQFTAGSGFTSVPFKGSAHGVAAYENLTSLSRRTPTQWIMGFDSAGAIGALNFTHGDLLSYDTGTTTFAGALYFDSQAAGNLVPRAAALDAAEVSVAALNTPTPSPSPSPSPSASPSPTPSASASASPSASPSPSPSASRSPSQSPSPTASNSPSPTASASASQSPSLSPSSSASSTPSPSPSASASQTSSPSPSPSASASPSASSSLSPTASPTAFSSLSPSASPSPSGTPSPSTTASPTPSASSSPSPSASPTVAGSPTPTPTPNAAEDWEIFE